MPTTTPLAAPGGARGPSRATARGGLVLPVIDCGHPAFVLDPSPAEIDALVALAVEECRRQAKAPAFVQRLLAKAAARSSILARAMAESLGGSVSGLSTYLFKLGPEGLRMVEDGEAGRRPGALDLRIASSIHGVDARLRLRASAGLLAQALAPSLARRPGLPARLLNLGGGPSADSLNALLALRRGAPGLLEGRRTTIYVLDSDAEGPAFGARCLDALAGEGGALGGLDAAMLRVAYDWNDARPLRALASELAEGEAVVAASSEGGLLEYGDDEAVLSNLEALARAGSTALVGSIGREDGAPGELNARTARAIRLRGRTLGGLERLAARAGWRIGRTAELPLTRVVTLEPAR